jgi:hypothetical protein
MRGSVISHADFMTIGILIVVLTVSLIMNPRCHNQAREWLFLASLVVLPGEGVAAFIVMALSNLGPSKIDLYIFRIDSFFGYPEFYIGQFLHSHPWAGILLSSAYSLLGSAMLATFATYLWKRSKREALTVAITFLLNLFAAIPIYLLFPVCGPRYAFPDFPSMPSQYLIPHMMVLPYPPNGIPSVHTSTALIVLYLMRYWHTGRIFGTIFLLLTIFSTLGLGHHYFFDLICAIPYSIGIIYCAESLTSLQPVVNSVAQASTCGSNQ